jgi:DNA repair photolyase
MSHDNKNNPLQKRTGRGADGNTSGRFESQRQEIDLSNYGWFDQDEESTLKTQFFKDSSRSIVTENDSPDLGFKYSMNFYRGCEHGCAYCYARPTHEYLGMSAGLDFESKIFVKEEAPELLRKKFMSKSWKPDIIMMSGNTDCYQPAERKFQITRRALQVLNEFGNPVGIITKNNLITRDLDIISEMAKKNLVSVTISITSLNVELARTLEPRTSSPAGRLEAVKSLSAAGVPVNVNIAPAIPGLNDHEIPAILKAVSEAGARSAALVAVRLPHSVKDIFSDWLATHRPDAQTKILNLIRSMRGGDLYNSKWGERMKGSGVYAENMQRIFKIFSEKYGLNKDYPDLSTDHFKRPQNQLSLFEDEG